MALSEDMIFWIKNGERGISSEVIFETLSGHLLLSDHYRFETPQDAADFGRCYDLLQLIPQWRAGLHKIPEKYPHWKLIVEHWGELERLYHEALKDQTTPNRFWKINRLLSKLNKYRHAPEKFNGVDS